MFDADRPIIKSDQDKLNRTPFAKNLARSILDHKDPDSLVVGLCGPSGSGKTSIINLTLEELNFASTNIEDNEKPIILNFSAWSYSGQHELIYSFFRRLSSALRNVTFLENSDRIIHLLELYVSFFTKKPVPKALRTKRSWWETITGQGKEEVYAWESGRDLTLVKAELNELLRNQNHKIIIVIDNISRLYPKEIKQIFQIVKSMGDYANTIYLLAFEKKQVLQALNSIDANGNELFDKVVQLPFAIPPILQQDLESIFADRLSEVLLLVPRDSWQIDYWANIYYGSLKYFFKDCRDITHYTNTLHFSYPHLKDVVNPVDFFALTAIEVFMPAVYYGIRDNKDLFTDLLEHVYQLTPDVIDKDKKRCEEIMTRSDYLSRDILLNLLLQLFPRLRQIYQPHESFYYSDAEARKLHRISSPDLFDAYFRLSMQAGELPTSEFETLLKMAQDKNAFDQALTRLNQDDRILKFLDQLDSKVIDTIPIKNVPGIINALLDDGDLFPQGIAGPLSLDTPRRIHRIIHSLLHHIQSQEERFAMMQDAISQASKSIFIIVHELQEQAREHIETSDAFRPIEYRDLSTEQLNALQTLTVNRIENWASTGRLATHPRLLPILYAWRNWGKGTAYREFVAQLTATDRGLIAFLIAVFDQAIAQVIINYQKNPAWKIYLKDIEAFISPKDLVAHAKTLFEDEYFEKLSEREQLALMIFLDLMHIPTKKLIPKTTV